MRTSPSLAWSSRKRKGETMEKEIHMNIQDGESFFAHQVSLNFSPTQFFIDFKNITPRLDERSHQPTISLKHNVVMMEPYHLVRFHELLNTVLRKYEEEFGKIEKPKQIEILEKKEAPKRQKQEGYRQEEKQPSYFG